LPRDNLENNLMGFTLEQLNKFLAKAALAAYAGGGPEVDPEEPGFKELEYKEDDWRYLDSYCGFFQSWGREVVWYKNMPIWNQLYGGGMGEKCRTDGEFEHKTFDFLKKALSAGEKQKTFQPRGPRSFKNDDWSYVCNWKGDIAKFSGHEEIFYKNEVVFTHNFIGGLVESKKNKK
jgi:hypothetical protein